ncbi:MAG: PQQ-binding-like beta-propeller repeat protein [Planctomycetota bacterium]
MSSDSTATDAGESPQPMRAAAPIAWVGLLSVVCFFVCTRDITRDYKVYAVLFSALLALAGVSLWVATRSSLSRRRRFWVAFAPWCLMLLGPPVGPVELINDGDGAVRGWRWRWSPEADELLRVPETAKEAADWDPKPTDYPRFLGNGYWAEASADSLDPKWDERPPDELWRRPIGAGWSGFAVVGDYAVTQEQRGEQELVTCYRIESGHGEGRLVWSDAEPVRWDPIGPGAYGGIGPRATPTIHEGRVYTHGATGVVKCLDARTGERLWSHDTFEQYGIENLTWGKATSPLIVDDVIVVSVGAPNASLVAYELEAGDIRWASGEHRASYASPILCEFGGIRQVVVVNEEFLTSHEAETGEVLWEHPWPGNSDSNASSSQPVPVGGDRVFLSKGYGVGCELLEVDKVGGEWKTTTLWKRTTMKTKMSNVVVSGGHVFGLDGGNVECISLETGKRQWKKRRRPPVGHGQLLLLGPNILILTESGEVVLIEASAKGYAERASFQALDSDQVTWNNPAVSGDRLLVRNAAEAACYRLPSLEAGVPEAAVE